MFERYIYPIIVRQKKDRRIYRLWLNINDALNGNEKDFTTGSIRKAIFLLAVPMVLEMIMESIFAVVDIFFVSKLGAGAVAVVGITESVLTMIYAISSGIAMATVALVSRRTGEKDAAGARLTAFQSILVGLTVSVFISLAGIFFSTDLLRLMGTEEAIIEQNYRYTLIMLSTNVVIIMLFIINAAFRSCGDAALSMRVLWLANGLNLILDPLLIFGAGPIPAMGVEGAAIATTIGRGVAVMYQFYILISGKGRIGIDRNSIKIDFAVMKSILKLSVGGVFQSIIATISWVGLYRIVAMFGNEALAGYTITIRIVTFSLLPSFGISNAAATLVGQNLGAEEPIRAEKSVWIAAIVNACFLGFISLFFITWPGFFIKLFIEEPEVVIRGAESLRIMCYGYIFYGFGMAVIQAFNGAGDTYTPTKVNLFCFWMLEIPLAYFLAVYLGYEAKGVYYSVIISEGTLTIISFLLFLHGKWKYKQV